MKKKPNPDWRRPFAEKIMEWGNIVFGGAIVIQVYPRQEISWLAVTLGIIVFVGSYYLAYLLLTKGGGKK